MLKYSLMLTVLITAACRTSGNNNTLIQDTSANAGNHIETVP
jgi:hypothetical protein